MNTTFLGTNMSIGVAWRVAAVRAHELGLGELRCSLKISMLFLLYSYYVV